MEYKYQDNDRDSSVTYHRERTGPNFFRVYYKQGCFIRYTPKEVGRVFGVAKFTPGVNAIREWCYEMIGKFGSDTDKLDQDYLKYIEKHGFGPEVHGDDKDDPTRDTKMII